MVTAINKTMRKMFFEPTKFVNTFKIKFSIGTFYTIKEIEVFLY